MTFFGHAGAEIDYAAAHDLVDHALAQRRRRADFRETVDHFRQPDDILVHLFDGRLVDGLRAQVLDPAQQRRGGRPELMGRLLGQPDPNAVLLVLLARAERDVAEGDEHDDDHQLDVGKIDQRLEQPRLVVENVERLVVHRGDPE